MNRGRDEHGQAILEFALAAPFLVMFILFLVDLALLGYSYVSVTNAVREGARCGAVGATDAAVQARVQATSGGLAAPSAVTVATHSPTVGGDIKVDATYTYKWITPVSLVPGLSSNFSFTKSATMRTEVARPASGVWPKASCP
jgi:Flp pilus assembly protein TadG